MSDMAIAARGLSKVYRVYASPWDRLREAITRRSRHREFAALQDVSFSLSSGQALAIIGENGAGKSTLLKMLAGITQPSSGTMEVHGKIASILELGSGFHPDFTGRQNIMLNAAMLGLSPAEVQQRLPDIIAWSELGDFIEQPVKCYSSGMAMRLGFSIATQVDPDILIIDEALSVGDGYFQKKCMDRLLRFVAEGGTLLFCSHAMYYASAFCQTALWLRHGRIEALGPVSGVVHAYEEFLQSKASSVTAAQEAPVVRTQAHIRTVELVHRQDEVGGRLGDGSAVPLYAPGDRWELKVEWDTVDPRLAFHVGVGINRGDGVEVCAFGSHFDGLAAWRGESAYQANLVLPHLPLVKGEFSIYVFLLAEEALHIYDQRVLLGAFRVESPRYAFGMVEVAHQWLVESPTAMPAALSARL
jgi:lipopolysaccharide transport system ATP-binding protein